MPAARIVVNSPSTHGAIGYSTALVPSMTLGCGSWGGNVTSDNISPLHLMDIKRVAFETRAVTSPNVSPTPTNPVASVISQLSPQVLFPATGDPVPKLERPGLDRKAVTDLVERFLAARKPQITMPVAPSPALNPPPEPPAPPPAPKPPPVPFVCEDDVRQASNKGEKIYINAKTILTPSARDLGNEKNVFVNG